MKELQETTQVLADLSLGRDINGNKLLKIKFRPKYRLGRGFSVQTLQNLPQTHSMNKYLFMTLGGQSIAVKELVNYIYKFGTKRQKTQLFS